MIDFKVQGKKNRAAGAEFEKRVRKDLEEDGWTVTKWHNTVNIEKDKLEAAKNKFRGKGIPMALGTGFPDFMAFRTGIQKTIYCGNDAGKEGDCYYEVIGVEAKTNGILDKKEKEKIKWLLDHQIFSKILIAIKTKVKNRIRIVYKDAREYLK